MTDPDPAIAAAAQAVAGLEPAADRARTAVAAAEAQLAAIDRRVAEHETSRAEIAARRRRGELHPDDGANLELAALDLAAFGDMRRDAEAVLAAARAAHYGVENELAAARRALDAAESLAAAVALGQHADRLATLLRRTIEQQGEAAAGLPAADMAALAGDAAARLAALETVMEIGIESAKAAAAHTQYRDRPTWRPSRGLLDRMRQADASTDGRL